MNDGRLTAESTLRLRALERAGVDLTQMSPRGANAKASSPEQVVKRARVYLDFLNDVDQDEPK